MNIYEKLQTMRLALQAQSIKKGGKNTYAKYDYYELADFLPQINKIMLENKVTSIVTFTKDIATLTLVDCEKLDARIEFTSPMATAQLKGAHEIQNLGAVETYQRRYLYMAAFEIVEADTLDGGQGKADPAAPPNTNPNWCSVKGSNVFVVDIKNNLMSEIERLWKFAGWDTNALVGYIHDWAANKNIPAMNDTTYKTLLKEQVDYLRQTGKEIEELPF